MKRIGIFKKMAVVMGAFACALSITACGGNGAGSFMRANSESNHAPNEAAEANVVQDAKLRIVTTIFPEYDWVREILGETARDVELTMLLDNGVDLHSYQPTVDDIAKIATCDVFIYVGGESDVWVDHALAEAINPDMKVIDLLDVLGEAVKEEEVIEGMEAEEEEGEEEEEPEYDEHVWLSLKNTETLVQTIAEVLEEVNPEQKDVYQKNAQAYIEKISDLDAEYQQTVDNASNKTILFGDRFPFRYLTDDYGLDYYAAFVGCSAETEASFQTIAFLSGKVDELSLHYVMTIEGSNPDIAETIIQNTAAKDQKIETLNSMQSTTMEDVEQGVTYLKIMEDNLDILKTVLE